eukprot:8583337-Pyramimonas_sp.AAC.1
MALAPPPGDGGPRGPGREARLSSRPYGILGPPEALSRAPERSRKPRGATTAPQRQGSGTG